MDLITSADIIKWRYIFGKIINSLAKESIDALNSKNSLTKWYASVKKMNNHLLPIKETEDEINFTQLRKNLTTFNKKYYAGFFERYDVVTSYNIEKQDFLDIVSNAVGSVVKDYYKDVEPILDKVFIKKISKNLDM